MQLRDALVVIWFSDDDFGTEGERRGWRAMGCGGGNLQVARGIRRD